MSDYFDDSNRLTFVKLRYDRPEDNQNFEIGQQFMVRAVDRGQMGPGCVYLGIVGDEDLWNHQKLDKFIADMKERK